MSRVIRRRVGGKDYYYLEESVFVEGKWAKESKYLGGSVPEADELEVIYGEFVRKLAGKGIAVLTPPFTEFITRKTAAKLAQATREKTRSISRLSPGARAEFIKRERITFITDSNAIEGSTLDYYLTERALSGQKRTEKLLKQGFVVTGIGREEQEAMNLNSCLDAYEKWLKEKRDISEEMILRLHYILLAKIEGYEKYRGVYRPVNVMIRGSAHKFPQHFEVPPLMRQLLEWYYKNKGLIHPVELAAKFHNKFTTIHPFADGNGRSARLLMNYILQLNGFPFTNIPFKKRGQYIKTQAEANEENSKPFTQFLTKEILTQSKAIKTRKT